VLDRFRADDCSFLTPSSFAQKALLEETSIDVSHEALLRRWQRASGDPTATDAAAIKGWLRVEDDDGQHYRRLLSTKKVDAKQIKEEWTWWNALRPTPDWAKRYGGRYEQVKEMLESSWRSRNIGIGTKVAGAAAIAAALVVAPFVAQEIALKERSAVESYLLAVSSADLLMDEVQEALNRGALPLASARKLLTVAEKIVEQVNVKETALVARMRSELLVMTSDVYGDLDDTDNALKYAKTAKALAESFLRSNPTNRGWQIALYRSLFRIADAEANLKDDAQALQDYRQALDIVETIFKKAPNDPEIGREVAFIYGKLGDMSLKHGKSQDARVDYDKSVQILQDLVAKYPDNEPCARDLGTSYARVGWALQAQDKYQDALAMYHMALETRERLLAKRQHSTTYLSHVADSLIEVANTLMRLKRSEEAIAEYRKAVMRRQAALDEDATNLAYQGALAAGLELLGDALKKTGNSAEAMDNYKKALAIRERLVGADPANLKRQRSLENLKKRMDEPASAPIEQVGTVPPSRP
jgi:tetratricopeptide (TPR) repeat protein